ncbi:diguanylate cyclase (GGDEF) domain-containing protein,uncharacterized domain HDIG-containing protein [Desulfosporosinus acidiphilus SJ4]|uniref:Diguanylate cyclase (GGDEF) domain-containing protein,uncharacterized domain HDIG-containing protein n=1 Tax=Desulfosporosinus acidiphilus (strain DSM 22704 / JCM 16185 / SJ4) TaxID=646529 RepID=I4D253_DESAJ|nr:PocR ligand-binding domain-containing protein [Desulfosporosinus acidiphilus]AFM39877.1 diguanylate cyclase (GGDEF) domain-containing protein,uncharacterized domain HDIG-containing protein [Desulfosporosinus acidiphilus SJ4]
MAQPFISCDHNIYKLSNLFDLREIQKLQDLFSAATGVASLITEPDGTPITEPSGFCNLCLAIRSTEKGLNNCRKSDSMMGSPQKDGPKIRRCSSGGLLDAGASIIVDGIHIANWLIGQVLDEDAAMEDLMKYTDEIGVKPEVSMDALKDVKRMSKLQFENICRFLFFHANQLSMYAAQNLLLIQEIGRRKIFETEIKNLNHDLELKIEERTLQLQETVQTLEDNNAELEEINTILEEEIAKRKKAEEEVLKLNEELERKVGERTRKLQELNAILEEEIMEKTMAENELKKEKVLTDALFNSAPGMIYLYDENSNLVRWNRQHEEMTGYSSEELAHMKLLDWYKGDKASQTSVAKGIKRANRFGFGEAEANLQKKDGTKIPMYFTAGSIFIDGKQYFAGVGIDITDRKRREEENHYLSYHDVLTGLYNRRFYEEEIKRLDINGDLPLSIIIGDVNGLKVINDAFGHDKGDELLKKSAEAIQRSCKADDIVARWGGDEFVILLPKTKKEEAEQVVQRINDRFAKIKINTIQVSMSFGLETKEENNVNIHEVLKRAEDAMYKHKVLANNGMMGNLINTIINTLHEKNPREEQHSKRVSQICQMLGRELNLSESEVGKLKAAGLLHDIGKIAIEESILNKPGRPTETEWDQIKRHPEIGYRILSTSKEMSDLADCILAHHERWDGKGYPRGLMGENIPMISRIIALADSFDAMISERVYRNALSKEEALAEIEKNSGTQFDPGIAEIFIKVLAKE